MASIAASIIPQETPSKAAAKALAEFDLNSKAASTTSEGAAEKGAAAGDAAAPSLLSKMQATMSTKDQSRTYHELTLNNGEKLQHASVAPRTKFVGDLSITDDSQEPLLKETASRFVLFPIQYHEVCARKLSACTSSASVCADAAFYLLLLTDLADVQEGRGASALDRLATVSHICDNALTRTPVSTHTHRPASGRQRRLT